MMVVDPEFVIFTGPMFGGKTTRLLSELERYKLRQKKVYTFKPMVDTRYESLGKSIITHRGYEMNSIPIESAESIIEYLNKRRVTTGVIAVDEAFMVPNISDVLIGLFRRGFTVLVSSIQLSSDGTPFDEVTKMMPWATKIEVCPAVCPITGKDAYYSYRKTADTEKIVVGGTETYEPRCFETHDVIRIKEEKNE